MKGSGLIGSTFAFVLVLIVGACALSPDPTTDEAPADTARARAAFDATVHPWVVTNCASCHGGSQVPNFAVSDTGAALNTALGYMNLQTPASSDIVSQSKNNHCGQSNCQTDGTQLTKLIGDFYLQGIATPTPTPAATNSPAPTLTPTP